jgi:hypothetical protein
MIKLAIYHSEEGIDAKIIAWGEIQEIGYGDFYFCYKVDNVKHPQYIYLTNTEHRHVSVFINEKEYVITNHHSPSGPTINRLLKIKDKINALIVQENIKTAIDSLPG